VSFSIDSLGVVRALVIRNEVPSDISEIRRITELAFRGMPYAAGNEQDVIDRLRSAIALTLSIVATEAGNVVGHIAFSPATLNSKRVGWFALGPVSVVPERQGQGIGSKLILSGLKLLESDGAAGCILTGNPNYYSRFGFLAAPNLCPAGEPAASFMMKNFKPVSVEGSFAFHGAFYSET